MSGVVCAKVILCSNGGRASLDSVAAIALLREQDYDSGNPLSPKEFADVVEFLEMVEEKGAALAKQIGK